MFEVELAKLCALFKAVHFTYQVIVKIYLDQASEASQSATHVCEEVILQVQDLKIRALAGKEWQVGVFWITDLHRAQALPTHLKVSFSQEVRCMVNGWLLTGCAQEQHPS